MAKTAVVALGVFCVGLTLAGCAGGGKKLAQDAPAADVVGEYAITDPVPGGTVTVACESPATCVITIAFPGGVTHNFDVSRTGGTLNIADDEPHEANGFVVGGGGSACPDYRRHTGGTFEVTGDGHFEMRYDFTGSQLQPLPDACSVFDDSTTEMGGVKQKA